MDSLTRANVRLHHPEPLVLQRHLGRIQLRVGAEYPLAVVASFVHDLGLVDLEVIRTTRVQIAAVALVADQRLLPGLELLTQRRHDRLPIGGILAGLVLVATDDVATALHPDLLDVQG